MTTRILVSACLLGQPVRYDGRAATRASDILLRWREEERLVLFCPEVAGGLGVPRPPAEIQDGDGAAVLAGEARVTTESGRDVTDPFVRGAQRALETAREHGIQIAVLKERSPSCGSGEIYDGTFSGERRAGLGVTSALLRENGIEVFGESELRQADEHLRELDRSSR